MFPQANVATNLLLHHYHFKCIWLTTICHSADGPPTPTDASFYLEIPPSLLKLASKSQTMCNRENWISSLERPIWWHSSKTWHLCCRQQTMSNQEATNKFVPSKHRNPSQTNSLPCSYCCNYGRCACTRSTSHLQVIVMRQLSLICLAVQQTIISGFKTDRLGRAHFPQYGYPPLNTHLVCGIILPDRSRSNLAVDVFGIKYFEKTDIDHFYVCWLYMLHLPGSNHHITCLPFSVTTVHLAYVADLIL